MKMEYRSFSTCTARSEGKPSRPLETSQQLQQAQNWHLRGPPFVGDVICHDSCHEMLTGCIPGPRHDDQAELETIDVQMLVCS